MLTDAQFRNAVCPPDKKQVRFTDAGGMYLQVSRTTANTLRPLLKRNRTSMMQQWADYLNRLAACGDVIQFKAA